MLFLELEFMSCFTVPTNSLIVMQLLHQSSFSQGINYGNSQVYSLFPFEHNQLLYLSKHNKMFISLLLNFQDA